LEDLDVDGIVILKFILNVEMWIELCWLTVGSYGFHKIRHFLTICAATFQETLWHGFRCFSYLKMKYR